MVKKIFKLGFFPFLIFLSSFIQGYGQTPKVKRFFISHGISIGSEYFSSLKRIDTNKYFNRGLTLAGYTLNTRLIIAEVNNNTSVSLDAPLSLAASVSSAGFGSISVPIMLSFNFGNIATSTADKDKGIVLGFGAQYINSAILQKADLNPFLKKSWIQPCMNLGYRYWNKRNKAREINLKLAYNPGQLVQTSKEEMGSTKTFLVRIAYIFYPAF